MKTTTNNNGHYLYPREVWPISNPVDHHVTFRVNHSHMFPHALPGLVIYGEATLVDPKQNLIVGMLVISADSAMIL